MVKIGTQTFGLEKEFTTDFEGTIRALHEIGFDSIEPFVMFNKTQGKLGKNLWALDTLSEGMSIMREVQMSVPSAHIGVGFGIFSMPAGKIVENILMLREKTGIDTFVISGPFGTVSLAKKWGHILGKVSREVSASGCTILCHNHDDEFHRIKVKGQEKEALEYFFELAGENVLLQLDIGWAGFAKDETAIVKKYADRIFSLHMKDFYPGNHLRQYKRNDIPAELFAPVGEGFIQTEEIINMLDSFPRFSGNIIMDVDKCSGSMLETLKISHDNIRNMLK